MLLGGPGGVLGLRQVMFEEDTVKSDDNEGETP
jgi:hypothetical protein